MTSIAILGAGGVGGLLAAALTRAGSAAVTVVAREPTAEVIDRDGIAVDSERLGTFTARPAVVARLDQPGGVLIIAVKATGLQAALERVAATPDLVVPLLNGIEHLATLRARFGDERVAAAAIRVEADRPAPATVVQRGQNARIDVAGDPSPELSDALRAAGLEVRTGAREPEVMWSKLGRLCPLALTTSASDRQLGFIREDPRWRSALENAVAETVATGVAEGAPLNAADSLAELDAAPAQLGSSMQRDLRAGRATELDAIAGAVVRAAQRHGLVCPTVRWLAERVALRAAAT